MSLWAVFWFIPGEYSAFPGQSKVCFSFSAMRLLFLEISGIFSTGQEQLYHLTPQDVTYVKIKSVPNLEG